MATPDHYHHGIGTTQHGYVKTLLGCFHPINGDPDYCDKSYETVEPPEGVKNPIGKITRMKIQGVRTIAMNMPQADCVLCEMRKQAA